MQGSVLMVAAGGTGGHLYPALAVAEEFRKLIEDAKVVFVGTPRGLESYIVGQAGFPLEYIRASPLRGGTLARKARGFCELFLGTYDSLKLLKRVRPCVVLGVGAYVSGTVLLTAAFRGTPSLILEPNAEPGLTNKWLAPFVDEAACGWKQTTRYFGKKAVLTGNPVRNSILNVSPLREQKENMHILVCGGSQGSRDLNRIITDSLPLFSDVVNRLQFTHQTGSYDLEFVKNAYAEHKIRANVTPYIENMSRAYAASDLVVARAGAITCAELAAVGRPSILIPISLAGGHQEKNAEMMQRSGAVRTFRSAEVTPEKLTTEITRLFDSPQERLAMAECARSLARPDAARCVAQRLVQLLQQTSKRVYP